MPPEEGSIIWEQPQKKPSLKSTLDMFVKVVGARKGILLLVLILVGLSQFLGVVAAAAAALAERH